MSNEKETPMTPAEMREYIMNAPSPMEGIPIAERDLPDGEGYDLAGRATAKALLLICEADPSLLLFPEGATDTDRAFHGPHWKAACEKWPGLDGWLGGITGFMFGWANNAVRFALEAEQVGNPAVADRVLVAPATAHGSTGIATVGLSAALRGPAETMVSVDATPVLLSPQCKVFRVELDTGNYRKVPFLVFDEEALTFEIPPTDFTGLNQASAGNALFVPLVDETATRGPRESS